MLRLVRFIFNFLCVLGLLILAYSLGGYSSVKSFCNSKTNASNMKHPLLVPRTSISGTSSPSLCVIARTYSKQLAYFPVFALSLFHTGLHNVQIYVINTDKRTDMKKLEQVIQFVNSLVFQKDFVILLPLDQTSKRKDFGYRLTDRVLTLLYEQYKYFSTRCEYITFTNADNLYCKNFTRKLLPHMQAGKDVIAWGFVSHYSTDRLVEIDRNEKTIPELSDDGSEKCLPAVFKRGSIDLSAVAYKLSFLEREKLYFMPRGWTDVVTLDGKFAEEASKRTNASVLLKQTLVFHQ